MLTRHCGSGGWRGRGWTRHMCQDVHHARKKAAGTHRRTHACLRTCSSPIPPFAFSFRSCLSFPLCPSLPLQQHHLRPPPPPPPHTHTPPPFQSRCTLSLRPVHLSLPTVSAHSGFNLPLPSCQPHSGMKWSMSVTYSLISCRFHPSPFSCSCPHVLMSVCVKLKRLSWETMQRMVFLWLSRGRLEMPLTGGWRLSVDTGAWICRGNGVHLCTLQSSYSPDSWVPQVVHGFRNTTRATNALIIYNPFKMATCSCVCCFRY